MNEYDERLGAFLLEANYVLSEVAYMDMVVAAGRLPIPDRDLFHRLYAAFHGAPYVAPEGGPS